MLSPEFAREFKRKTEERWATCSVKPGISGLQIQPGTRWNQGLSDGEIREYEGLLGFAFPEDLRAVLREMNGTDQETINIYASTGHPPALGLGVYAFPRDLNVVRKLVSDVEEHRIAVSADLANQGFKLGHQTKLFPFYGHRYVTCDEGSNSTAVLSIWLEPVDAIVYGDSLETYLLREFLDS